MMLAGRAMRRSAARCPLTASARKLQCGGHACPLLTVTTKACAPLKLPVGAPTTIWLDAGRVASVGEPKLVVDAYRDADERFALAKRETGVPILTPEGSRPARHATPPGPSGTGLRAAPARTSGAA